MKKKSKTHSQQKSAVLSRWDAQWKEQYDVLSKFRARHGHWPKVTDEFPSGNRLGQWANRQRDLHAQGRLLTERERALGKLGFSWDKTDERASHWNQQFEYLLAFRKRHPQVWPYARQDFPKGNRLGLWVWRQRQAFAADRLPKPRQKMLEKIRFPFELPDSWEEHFATLKQYRQKFPEQWPKAREEYPKGNRLGLWCHLQRCAFKTGALLPDRVSKLAKMGFQWSVKQVSWMRFYDQLKAYKRKNSKLWPVLEASALDDRRLIAWCSTQRHKRKIGKLDKDKIALLDKIDFRW